MRRVTAVLFALSIFAATSSTLSAQQSIYMLVDSIRGDQPAPHDREFKLNSFSSSTTNTSAVSSGTMSGATIGKAAFPAVKVSMRFHAGSSPSFHRSVIIGTKMPSVEIRFYNSSNRMFYKTVFENVYFTNIAIEGADEAVQQIEFVYSKVRWFSPTDAAGLTAPVQIACWDVIQYRGC